MRTFKAALLLIVVFLIVPAPAYAWFDWLDSLSGPGPFNGPGFDFKLYCFMNQPPPSEAIAKAQQASRQFVSLGLDAGDTLFASAQEVLNRIANSPQPESPEMTLELAADAHALVTRLSSPAVLRGSSGDAYRALLATAARIEASLRAASVPSRSAYPGAVVWASCSDRLRNEPVSRRIHIRHEDRHPLVSIVLGYRDISNAAGFYHIFSEEARDSKYADGDAIHLRILEPKVSVPLSGHFDFLDGQAGLGVYNFASAGFKPGAKSFSGFMVEPLRFDFHVPGKLVENIKGNSPWSVLERLPLSVSFSCGFMMFPGGFSAGQFNGAPGVEHDIRGSELIPEYGFVVNVGRLLGL